MCQRKNPIFCTWKIEIFCHKRNKITAPENWHTQEKIRKQSIHERHANLKVMEVFLFFVSFFFFFGKNAFFSPDCSVTLIGIFLVENLSTKLNDTDKSHILGYFSYNQQASVVRIKYGQCCVRRSIRPVRAAWQRKSARPALTRTRYESLSRWTNQI